MKTIRISRFHAGKSTIGTLSLKNEVICFTLERPWRDNKKKISCIPEGIYKATKHTSPKFGETYLFHDVPNRSEIMFHSGNVVADSQGCILLGTTLEDNDRVGLSKRAVKTFLDAMEGDKEITVEIVSAP